MFSNTARLSAQNYSKQYLKIAIQIGFRPEDFKKMLTSYRNERLEEVSLIKRVYVYL